MTQPRQGSGELPAPDAEEPAVHGRRQTQGTPPRYSENVRASAWLYFLLSTPVGVVLALMTGFAVTGSIGGSEAVVFYVVTGAAALALLFALVNFTNLSVVVTDSNLHFAFGVFNKRVALSSISGVEANDYSWVTYGGWGIRRALKGRRAWSVPGAKRGVVVHVTQKGGERSYFISSRTPDDLAKAILGAQVSRSG
ncbi:MAG: hypothetical protein EXR57_06710 [Dehalococcoidia bacterium]|nr:hypothetical protein [Dehalococcoidia bacterium]MSQ35479.1 hypothetical protein [Dehalococcoidia bacterium]